MTPLAQIVHVFRNDLRRMQWPLIAFAAVLGVVAALGADNTPLLGSGAVPMAAVFAGMLLMALLVQDQSPSATDASWRVLPLSPAAVFAAKLLVLATVLVIGGVAEWLALVRFDVPAADAASLTAITLWPYLNWLLSAALVASFTRGIRGFVAALILTPIGLVIVGLLFEQITTTMGVSFDSTPAHYRWLSIAALVAAPLVVGSVYLCVLPLCATRLLAVGTSFALLVALVGVGSTATFADDGHAVRTRTAVRSGRVAGNAVAVLDTLRPALSVRMLSGGADSGDVVLDVAIEAAPDVAANDSTIRSFPRRNAREILDTGALELLFPDGSTHHTPIGEQFVLDVRIAAEFGDTTPRGTPTMVTGASRTEFSASSTASVEIARVDPSRESYGGLPVSLVLAEPAHVPETPLAWPRRAPSHARLRVVGLTVAQRTALAAGTVRARVRGSGRSIPPRVSARFAVSANTKGRVDQRPGLRVTVSDTVRAGGARDGPTATRAKRLTISMIDGLHDRLQPALGIGNVSARAELMVLDTAGGVVERVRAGAAFGQTGALLLPGIATWIARYVLPISDDGRPYSRTRRTALGPGAEIMMVSWERGTGRRIESQLATVGRDSVPR